MTLREYQTSGLEYLQLVTALLQRARRSNPTGGLWEAADLQWWWRRDQHQDPGHQTFWLDYDTPIAAAILTDWGGRWACDLLSADHDLSDVVGTVWPRALGQIDALADVTVEMTVGDDDLALADLVTKAGFQTTDELDMTAWMPAAEPLETNPMRFSVIDCCARAVSGHAAAAPPSSVTNARLFIQLPRRRGQAASVALRGKGC